MKIYNIISESKSVELVDAQTEEVLIQRSIIYELEVNKEAVKLLKTTGGSTASRVKYLILNLWNCGAYPLENFDMFGMLRNADENFRELIASLFEMCSFSGDSCFHILDEIAPLFVDEFYSKSELQEREAGA